MEKDIRNISKLEPLKNLLQFGNTKLPKSTAIFNMGPAKNCPSAKLGLCELSTKCYALKAERLYKQVLPYRMRQAKYWLNVSAETFAYEFLESIARKKTKVTHLRFNESGDFYTQECYNKAEKIARILSRHGIKCYTYTHRTDLQYYNSGNALNIMKSGNNNNDYLTASYKALKPAEFNEKVINQHDNNFRANLPQDKYFICPGSCKTCSLCANLKAGTIYTKIH